MLYMFVYQTVVQGLRRSSVEIDLFEQNPGPECTPFGYSTRLKRGVVFYKFSQGTSLKLGVPSKIRPLAAEPGAENSLQSVERMKKCMRKSARAEQVG